MIDCSIANAPLFATWIKKRGGLALWASADLGNPSKTWTAPYLEEDGTVKPKQSWQMQDKPREIVTDPAQVRVFDSKELKRFHVGTKKSGFCSWSVTAAGSCKIEREVEKAGEGAYYEFDYGDWNNCVIMIPTETMTLKEWMEKNDPS
jgi:hypothetical protein